VTLSVKPISLNAARDWIAQVHRHLKRPITGWLFGVEILADGKRIGVACAGRPAARMLQDGVTCEITRVAVLEGHRNACSFAYGALRRAASALGYERVVTYTIDGEEPGTSLRAAGFVDDGPAGGGEADRPSRRRKPVENSSPKRRWVWRAGNGK
jgi:hypothetical protein